MTYNQDKVLKIINNVVVDCINQESHLLGKPKNQITIEQLSSKDRKREQVIGRQIGQYICLFIFNELLRKNLTLEYIGGFYNKDHATVLHSKKVISNYIDTDRQILYMIGHCMDICTRRIKEGESSSDCHRWYKYLYPKSTIL